MRAFREAVESGDLSGIPDLMADDVVFVSPVVFKPYPGKAITVAILQTVVEIFKDFRYVREYGQEGDKDTALMFETEVDGKKVMGTDFIRCNDEGKIVEFMVMMRPLSGVNAMAEQMTARFDEVVKRAEAMAG